MSAKRRALRNDRSCVLCYNFSMTFFIGSAVWAHQGWVGNFFPKGTKQADYLREYAKRLTTVEGNTTF